MIATFPRESIEFLPVTVTVDGVAVTAGVTFAVVASPARPTTFIAAVTAGATIGITVGTYPPGLYEVWAKVVAGTETPVINCGNIRIT